MKKTYSSLSLNLAFWGLMILMMLIPILTMPSQKSVWIWFQADVFNHIFFALTFYIFYFLVIPHFLFRKKFLIFLLLTLCIPAIVSLLQSWGFYPLYKNYFYAQMKSLPPLRLFLFLFSVHLSYGLMGGTFRFTINYFINQKQQLELEKKSVSKELAFLRTQINPEFMHSTLHRLKDCLQTDPQKTSDGIIRLSEILRYMLYEAVEEDCLLEKEIAQIKNLNELTSICSKNQKSIELIVDEQSLHLQVPSALLFSLTSYLLHNDAFNVSKLLIKIERIDDFITVRFIPDKNLSSSGFAEKGLGSFYRRLNLHYGSQFELKTQSLNGHSNLVLKIPVDTKNSIVYAN